jgi:hypothetical protein
MSTVRVGRLFVAGSQRNSIAARENLQRLRESAPECHLQVEVVDVLANYREALELGVLVTPCLVMLEPAPRVMIVGTLSDLGRVREAICLPAVNGADHG